MKVGSASTQTADKERDPGPEGMHEYLSTRYALLPVSG